MSNIDPKIASHASMWLKNAEQIERQLGRLTSDELEAYRYVRDIFKQPRPDMERLQVAQETLRDVGAELHDDFGAAVKTFAAKVSVIVKNFDEFRQAVTGGSPAADISEAKPAHKAAPKSDPKPEPPKPKERPMPEPPPEPKPDKQKVRIDGNDGKYYYGYVNNRQEPDGEGEFHYTSSNHTVIFKGIFHDGKFPETGSLTDGESTFTGKFSTYGTVSEMLNRYTSIYTEGGTITTDSGTTIETDSCTSFYPHKRCKVRYPDGTEIQATEMKGDIFYGECIRTDGVKEIGYISSFFIPNADSHKTYWHGVTESKAGAISRNGWLIAILTAILAIGLTLTGYMNFITLILLAALSFIPLVFDKWVIVFRHNRMNPLYFSSIVLILATLWISRNVSWWNLLCLLPAISPAAFLYIIWEDR